MTILDICRPSTSILDQPMDLCCRIFPCLADPGRRSTTCLKLVLLLVHLIYAGVLFLFDEDLIEKTKKEP
ncbi:putative S-acyltransferase, partial [Trifolium pratense]